MTRNVINRLSGIACVGSASHRPGPYTAAGSSAVPRFNEPALVCEDDSLHPVP
jgi:hypothetical protein